MADVTVPLSRTYGQENGRPFAALVFRCPRWQDFVDLGDIEEIQPVGGDSGKVMLVRHHDVVGAYAERCLKEPRTPGDLSLLELRDVLAVHAAVRGFFAEARPSPKSPTNSSGDSEKGLPTSGN